MWDVDMEDYKRDAELDSKYKSYKVISTVDIEHTITATSEEEAENIAYDQVEEALRGQDYAINHIEAEEEDDL